MIPVTVMLWLPDLDRPYCNDSHYVCQFYKMQFNRDFDWCTLFEYALKEKIIMGDGTESYDGKPLPVSRKIRCTQCLETCKNAEKNN